MGIPGRLEELSVQSGYGSGTFEIRDQFRPDRCFLLDGETFCKLYDILRRAGNGTGKII